MTLSVLGGCLIFFQGLQRSVILYPAMPQEDRSNATFIDTSFGSAQRRANERDVETKSVENFPPQSSPVATSDASKERGPVFENLDIERIEIEKKLNTFLDRPHAIVYEELRQGAPHPRLDEMYNAHERSCKKPNSISTTSTPMPREDIVSLGIPEVVAAGYRYFANEEYLATLAPTEQEQMRRAMHLIENRFFDSAADLLSSSASSVEPVHQKQLDELVAACRVAEKKETDRYQMILEIQDRLYAILEDAYPDRADAIQQRRLTERILQTGKLVGELRPVIEVVKEEGSTTTKHRGVSKPMLGLFELEIDGVMHERKAVVKFEMSDRYLRPGVSAGSGPMREVVGALHSVAFGLDNIPAVTIRQLNDAGMVSVHERVDARSCDRAKDWYKTAGEAFEHTVALMAAEDFLVYRTDGAPRNLLIKDGALIKIDCGADMPSVHYSPRSSAPLYHMQGKPIPSSVRETLQAYLNSSLPAVFEQAIKQLPENMDSYLDGYRKRLTELVHKETFPAYEQTWARDFHNTAFLEAHASKAAAA